MREAWWRGAAGPTAAAAQPRAPLRLTNPRTNRAARAAVEWQSEALPKLAAFPALTLLAVRLPSQPTFPK